MTAQSSSKGLFKTYLFYRIDQLKMNFILCCIMNVLGLPLYAVSAKITLKGVISDFAEYGKFFSIFSMFTLIVLAAVGAAFTFEFYLKKNFTDTIGSLALSHKERFLGDFLAGYITNAAPIIPCAVIGVIIFGTMQGGYDEMYSETSGALSMVNVGISTAATLFVIVTFTYLFSVLVISCCGKFLHSVIFSIFLMAGLPLLFGNVGKFYAENINGVDAGTVFSKTAAVFPPVGLIFQFTDSLKLSDLYGMEDLSFSFNESFSVFDPLYIVLYVILSAAVFAAAYMLGKRRKTENTGNTFVIKPMFFAISAVASAAVIFLFLNMRFYFNMADLGNVGSKVVTMYVVSIIAGVVMCALTILMCLPGKQDLFRSIKLGAAVIFACFVISLLFDKTGVFGARYLPANTEKIEYIKVDDNVKITDKADIERFTSMINDDLREYSHIIDYNISDYKVEVVLSNGRHVTRSYNDSYYLGMYRYVEKLDHYGDYFFQDLHSVDGEWDSTVIILENNVKYTIPSEKSAEFIAVMHEEAAEKYSKTSEKYAKVNFKNKSFLRSFDIQKDYEKTIAFVENFGEFVEPDSDSRYIKIDFYDKETEEKLEVLIRYKDRDNEYTKQLMELLSDNSDDRDYYFTVHNAQDFMNVYYVPKANRKRVLEIMTDIALSKFE